MAVQPPTKRLRVKSSVNTEGLPSDPLSSEARHSDSELKSHASHYFKRVAGGHVRKSTPQDKKEAEQALATLSVLDEGEKVQFAKAFQANKATKSFGFIREYSEKVTAAKSVKEGVNEKYMSRICYMDYLVQVSYHISSKQLLMRDTLKERNT